MQHSPGIVELFWMQLSKVGNSWQNVGLKCASALKPLDWLKYK